MMKYLLAAGLMMTGCASATADDLSQPYSHHFAWIEGHWRSESEGRVSEEIWTNGEGGLFLGVNRTIRDGQARGFEFLRIIVTDEGAAYCAQPGGGEAVCFDWVQSGMMLVDDAGVAVAGTVEFANPDHDFPQIITYQGGGDQLTATISDLSRETVITFSWTRVED